MALTSSRASASPQGKQQPLSGARMQSEGTSHRAHGSAQNAAGSGAHSNEKPSGHTESQVPGTGLGARHSSQHGPPKQTRRAASPGGQAQSGAGVQLASGAEP